MPTLVPDTSANAAGLLWLATDLGYIGGEMEAHEEVHILASWK